MTQATQLRKAWSDNSKHIGQKTGQTAQQVRTYHFTLIDQEPDKLTPVEMYRQLYNVSINELKAI